MSDEIYPLDSSGEEYEEAISQLYTRLTQYVHDSLDAEKLSAVASNVEAQIDKLEELAFKVPLRNPEQTPSQFLRKIAKKRVRR